MDLDSTVNNNNDDSSDHEDSGALGIPGRAFKMLKLSPSFRSWGSFSAESDDIFDKIGSFW